MNIDITSEKIHTFISFDLASKSKPRKYLIVLAHSCYSHSHHRHCYCRRRRRRHCRYVASFHVLERTRDVSVISLVETIKDVKLRLSIFLTSYAFAFLDR